MEQDSVNQSVCVCVCVYVSGVFEDCQAYGGYVDVILVW